MEIVTLSFGGSLVQCFVLYQKMFYMQKGILKIEISAVMN
jgi:hypothetical protein